MDIYESLLVNIGFATNNYFNTITFDRLNKYTDLAYDGPTETVIDIKNGDVYHTVDEKEQTHIHQVLEQWIHFPVGGERSCTQVDYLFSVTPEHIDLIKKTTYIFNIPFLPWSTNYFEQEDGSIIIKAYKGQSYRSPLASDQLLLKAQSTGIILITLYGTYRGIKFLKNKVF